MSQTKENGARMLAYHMQRDVLLMPAGERARVLACLDELRALIKRYGMDGRNAVALAAVEAAIGEPE